MKFLLTVDSTVTEIYRGIIDYIEYATGKGGIWLGMASFLFSLLALFGYICELHEWHILPSWVIILVCMIAAFWPFNLMLARKLSKKSTDNIYLHRVARRFRIAFIFAAIGLILMHCWFLGLACAFISSKYYFFSAAAEEHLSLNS